MIDLQRTASTSVFTSQITAVSGTDTKAMFVGDWWITAARCDVALGRAWCQVKCNDTIILGETGQPGGKTLQFENYNLHCVGTTTAVHNLLAVGVVTSDADFQVTAYANASTMATNTPYIESKSYDNGIEYSYNPLTAQLGYGMWIIFSLACIYAIFKILK